MKKLSILMVAMLAVFALSSCSKDDDDADVFVEYAADVDEVEVAFDEADAEVDDITTTGTRAAEAVLTGSGTRNVNTVQNNDGTMTKTITYANFSNGYNLRVKNGVIVVTVTGTPAENTYQRSFTFQNFTIDGIKVEGTRTIQKTAQYAYTISLAGGKVTFTDGKSCTRTQSHTRTMTSGMDTPNNIWDDIFAEEGSATGLNRNGNTYTHTIMTALQKKRACRWISQGTASITVGEETATIDYGDGTCDATATMTRAGKTTQVKFRGGN